METHAKLVRSFLEMYERIKAELKTCATSICSSVNDDLVDDELVKLYIAITRYV
jgi:DNA-directed RNA polymerase specialized sigma24 family protein